MRIFLKKRTFSQGGKTVEDATAKTKKKPPAHEVILQEITRCLVGLPADYFSFVHSSDQWTEEQRYFATRVDTALTILSTMHIPAAVLETVKQNLGARGLSADYLYKLSE